MSQPDAPCLVQLQKTTILSLSYLQFLKSMGWFCDKTPVWDFILQQKSVEGKWLCNGRHGTFACRAMDTKYGTVAVTGVVEARFKAPSHRFRFRRRSGYLLWHAKWVTNSFVTKLSQIVKLQQNQEHLMILGIITRWWLISEKENIWRLILKQNKRKKMHNPIGLP